MPRAKGVYRLILLTKKNQQGEEGKKGEKRPLRTETTPHGATLKENKK